MKSLTLRQFVVPPCRNKPGSDFQDLPRPTSMTQLIEVPSIQASKSRELKEKNDREISHTWCLKSWTRGCRTCCDIKCWSDLFPRYSTVSLTRWWGVSEKRLSTGLSRAFSTGWVARSAKVPATSSLCPCSLLHSAYPVSSRWTTSSSRNIWDGYVSRFEVTSAAYLGGIHLSFLGLSLRGCSARLSLPLHSVQELQKIPS